MLRRHYGRPLSLSPGARNLRLLVKLFVLIDVLVLVAWGVLLSYGAKHLIVFTAHLNPWFRVTQFFTAMGLFGVLFAVIYAVTAFGKRESCGGSAPSVKPFWPRHSSAMAGLSLPPLCFLSICATDARGALAAGTEMAAAAGDDDAADARGAAAAFLTFAIVDAMIALVFSHFARRVHVVGNRRAAQAYGVLKNPADRMVEAAQFFRAQRTS